MALSNYSVLQGTNAAAFNVPSSALAGDLMVTICVDSGNNAPATFGPGWVTRGVAGTSRISYFSRYVTTDDIGTSIPFPTSGTRRWSVFFFRDARYSSASAVTNGSNTGVAHPNRTTRSFYIHVAGNSNGASYSGWTAYSTLYSNNTLARNVAANTAPGTVTFNAVSNTTTNPYVCLFITELLPAGNTAPTITGASISPTNVHRNPTTLTVTNINDGQQHMVRRRFRINGVAQPWSDWMAVPVSGGWSINNTLLNVGTNQIVMDVQDVFGLGASTTTFTVTKSNAIPDVTISHPATVPPEGVTVTGTITDGNSDDMVSYQIALNDEILVPYGDYMAVPYTYSLFIPASSFRPGSNTIAVTVMDDFNDATRTRTGIIELVNLPPEVSLILTEEVHDQNAVLTVHVDDPDGDRVRLRVEVNETEIVEWTALQEVPYNFTVPVDNSLLITGDNEVIAFVEDVLGGEGQATAIVRRVNAEPVVSNLRLEGHVIKANITDADGDRIRYRIVFNGTQIAPEEGFTLYRQGPIPLWFRVPENLIRNNQNNQVTVEAIDNLGDGVTRTVNKYLTYVGLLFHDEDGNFYSTHVGDVLKYLQMGSVVAGNRTEVYQVWLKNTLGYTMKNVKLHVNQGDLDGNTTEGQISYTRDPFVPSDLTFPQINYDQSLSFFVRVDTTEQGVGRGKFDIVVEAEPQGGS